MPSGCDGCAECALRCTAGIAVSRSEYRDMLRELRGLPAAARRRALTQPKELPWADGATYRACLFLDIDTRRCLVYPARPLICRLFGRVPHLPCPREAFPPDLDARRQWRAYRRRTRRTFEEWLARDGYAGIDALLAAWEGLG